MHDACDQSDIIGLFHMKYENVADNYLWYKFHTKLPFIEMDALFAVLTNTFLDRIWTISLKRYTILLPIQRARYAISVYAFLKQKKKQVLDGKKIKKIRDKENTFLRELVNKLKTC